MDEYLVVGNPVEHSLSPQIHAAFAEQTKQDMGYAKALVPLGGFAEFVDRFAAGGGKGLNVTVPFKPDAFAYVDEHDQAAQTALAVNTIILGGNRSRGANTDGVGLRTDLTQRHGLALAGQKILVLGAGGAAQGILQPLLEACPSEIIIANRTLAKAETVVQAFAPLQGETKFFAVGLQGIVDRADIVINSTSMGLQGETTVLPQQVIEGAFCYDLAYGSSAVFCAWARHHGARAVSDGLGMLVEQAATSFEIWRGVRPATQTVYSQLREQIDGPKQAR